MGEEARGGRRGELDCLDSPPPPSPVDDALVANGAHAPSFHPFLKESAPTFSSMLYKEETIIILELSKWNKLIFEGGSLLGD